MKRIKILILGVSVFCTLLVACGKAKETEVVQQETIEAQESIIEEVIVEEEPVEPELPPEPVIEIDKSKEYIYDAHEELTKVDYASPALLGITEDAGTDYTDKLYFICDSPTYWMGPNGLLSEGTDTKQIWTGPEGTQTLAYQSTYKILDPFDHQEKLIIDVVAEHQPEYVVIALGINGISFMDEEAFTKDYTEIITNIQTVSPDTIILCSSIYPITPSYRYWGSITNALITEGNSWILKIAEQTGTHYVDTFSAILGDDGNALPEYMQGDGLHPNKSGLEQILLYHRTHAYLPKET